MRGGGTSNDKLTEVASLPAWTKATNFRAMKNPDFVRKPLPFESAKSQIYESKWVKYMKYIQGDIFGGVIALLCRV